MLHFGNCRFFKNFLLRKTPFYKLKYDYEGCRYKYIKQKTNFNTLFSGIVTVVKFVDLRINQLNKYLIEISWTIE